MFKIGDKVKTLPVESYTELANKLYSNRNAVVVEISFPFGLHKQYKVQFDEPFTDHGYIVTTKYYYDFDNALMHIA